MAKRRSNGKPNHAATDYRNIESLLHSISLSQNKMGGTWAASAFHETICCWRSSHSPPLAHALDPGGNQAVGNDADEGDDEARHNAAPGIGLGQRLEHFLAQVAGAHHGADDDHAEGEEDCLIDAQHDLGHGDGKLHAAEELPLGAARYDARFQQFMGHLPDAVIGVAHRRHDGECDGGDQRRHVAHAEKHDDGNDETE